MEIYGGRQGSRRGRRLTREEKKKLLRAYARADKIREIAKQEEELIDVPLAEELMKNFLNESNDKN